MIPLGLKHPDHIEVRNQALEVYKSRRSGPPWFVYTDLPYGEEWPELIERAESELEAEGFMRHRYETSLDTDFEHKLQAVECYASQTALLFESSALGSVPTISVRASFRRLHRLRRLLHRGTVFSYSQIVSESYGQLQAT